MEPFTQPSRQAEGTGCGSSLTSFGRHGTNACAEVGSACVDLAPHRSNLVEGSRNLAGLLPPEVRIFFDGEHELMRRTREETRALFEDGGVVKPYTDSALRHHKKRYLTFLRQLRSKGMLKFVEAGKGPGWRVFVSKSPKTKSRFIIDSRLGNGFFKVPSAVKLCSSETFSRIEVETTCGLMRKNLFLLAFQGSAWRWVWQMSDCFHQMRIPFRLGAWFCLPQVTAGEMDVVGMDLGNGALGPYDLIFPCPATLPKGFSWSVYLCQCVEEALFKRATRLEKCPSVNDRESLLFLQECQTKGCEDCSGYVYEDHIGVSSTSRSRARRRLTMQGLLTHSVSVSDSQQVSLGTVLDRERRHSALAPRRFWKLRRRIDAILQAKTVMGTTLEVVIGHATFCSLLARPAR